MLPFTLLPFSRLHLCPGDRICAAVSGGADSVALLLALHAANRQQKEALGVVLSIVHVHHGLRGEEADADAAFVANLCARLQLPLRVFHVDVPAHVDRTGETLEEAARNLRYATFRNLISEGLCDSVLTAHTLDDQAETVLIKLLRGAWTDGLSAIHPVLQVTDATGKSIGKIIRPLLGVARSEISAFLRNANQQWREDSSNTDLRHTRNRVRHEVLPLLREYNPRLDQALANMAELAREEEARWQGEVGRVLPPLLLPGKPVRGGGRAVSTASGTSSFAMEIDRIRGLDPALRRRVLRAAARQLGARLNFDETARLLALAGLHRHPTVTPRIGSVLQLANGLRVERSHREIRFSHENS